MAPGSKKSYTGKQKRKAEKIAKSYKKRGVSAKEAKARAWATTNKESGGGEKSGSGRGRKTTKTAARKGGRKGGKKAAAKRKK
jgi:plasmid stabilization system protein ParE